MGYWRGVAKRAWDDAEEAVGLGTGERVLVALLIQAVIAVGIYLMLGSTGLRDAEATRIMTAVAPFATFPLMFLWKLPGTPAKLAAEKQLELDAALVVRATAEERKGAYRGGRRVAPRIRKLECV